MVKLIGIIFVFCFFAYLGYEKSHNYKIRYLYLEGIINGITYLKKEIEYFSFILEEAFINSAPFGGIAKDFFLNVGNGLKGKKIESLGVFMEKELITEDIRLKTIISQLGSQMGKSDVETEALTIEKALVKLNELYVEYKEEYKKKGTFVYKITILCGVLFIVVIM